MLVIVLDTGGLSSSVAGRPKAPFSILSVKDRLLTAHVFINRPPRRVMDSPRSVPFSLDARFARRDSH